MLEYYNPFKETVEIYEDDIGAVELFCKGDSQQDVGSPCVPELVKTKSSNKRVQSILRYNDIEYAITDTLATMCLYQFNSILGKHAANSACTSVTDTLAFLSKNMAANVLHLSISKYVESIPQQVIEDAIIKLMPSGAYRNYLLELYSNDEVYYDGKVVAYRKALTKGTSFDWFLLGYILRKVDNVMASLPFKYYRYYDEIFILSDSMEAINQIPEHILRHLNVTINESTPIYHNEVEFHGLHIMANSIRNSKDVMQKVKSKIHRFIQKHSVKHDRESQQNLIYSLQRYLYKGDKALITPLLKYVNNGVDARELDRFCLDEIKASYTGSYHKARNDKSTPDELIYSMGWVDIAKMCGYYNVSLQLYESACEHYCTKPVKHYVNISFRDAFYMLSSWNGAINVNTRSHVFKAGRLWYKVENPPLLDSAEMESIGMFLKSYNEDRIFCPGTGIVTTWEEAVERYDTIEKELVTQEYENILKLLVLYTVDKSVEYNVIDGIYILSDLYND